MAINFTRAEFVLSAASPNQFVRDGLHQLAFAGRSNVGKSSVINRLVNRKNFARVGASPGKTTQINYFRIDNKLYLVDLPGYGYARVSKAERDDVTMHNFFVQTGCPVVIVANKLDKLKKSEIEPNLARVRETLELRPDEIVVPFSAERGDGKEQLLGLLRKFCE